MCFAGSPPTLILLGMSSSYDLIADIYDDCWGHFMLNCYASTLDQFLVKYFATKHQILDLCCGTGTFTEFLVQKGYTVSCVDESERMLEAAKRKLPSGSFYHLPWSRLSESGLVVDGVFCLHDSLNHIHPQLISDALVSVRETLSFGGIFVFDINTIQGFKERWRGEFTRSFESCVCYCRPDCLFDDRGELLSATMSVELVPDVSLPMGRSVHFDIVEYDVEKSVLDAISSSGFEVVEIVDSLDVCVAFMEVGRRFYVLKAI